MKTALKCKNDEFLVMPLQHVLSVMDLVNHSGTPKLWAISHENGPKTQNRRVFGHASQTCTECHGPCKSLQKPKTVGKTTLKCPKKQKL
jgi:formamidopyrimidine-DNA glycosylase